MSFLASKLAFTSSSRVASAVLGLSLVAVGTAIYLTPGHASSSGAGAAVANRAQLPTSGAAAAPTAPSTAASSAPAAPTPKATPSRATPVYRTTVVDVVHVPAKVDVVVVKKPGPVTVKTKVVTTAPPAQPQVTVAVPTKAALVQPATKYYGLAEDGLPGSSSLFDRLDRTADKAPNLVEWFAYWDDSYSPQKVTQAWQRDALPVITWQSAPHDWSNTGRSISAYSMKNIASGTFDKYLGAFATSVVETGLPVAIRLDQEMNGNWYPWSAGYNSRGIRNSPADFVAAWRHVWSIFQAAGANQYVIWAWTPSRTDTLTVDSSTGYTAGDTGLKEDYPGDDYVDWMGMSAYQFRPTEPATYDWIFGGTLHGNSQDMGLEQLSSKPIFIAEWGSAQVVGTSTDNTVNKVALTTSALAEFADDPQIVGFSLFNNDVNGLHTIKLIDGTHLTVDTNWQIDSSAAALTAFQHGIADARYGAGLMPLAAGTTVRVVPPKSGGQ